MREVTSGDQQGRWLRLPQGRQQLLRQLVDGGGAAQPAHADWGEGKGGGAQHVLQEGQLILSRVLQAAAAGRRQK